MLTWLWNTFSNWWWPTLTLEKYCQQERYRRIFEKNHDILCSYSGPLRDRIDIQMQNILNDQEILEFHFCDESTLHLVKERIVVIFNPNLKQIVKSLRAGYSVVATDSKDFTSLLNRMLNSTEILILSSNLNWMWEENLPGSLQ